MNDKVILDDLDLLALADGLLETDPVRRAEVEAAIAASPAEFARLRDYRAQTQALRSAYGGRISEPVPERLQAALEGGDGGHWRPLLRIAAGVALVVAAGLGGWIVGQADRGDAGRALVDQSYRQFAARAPDEPGDAITLAATGQRPLGWLEDDVSIRLRAPDLSSERFALVDKQAHRDGDEQIIRLDYAAPDGRAFSLFIAPRWEDRAAPIREAERDGVALAYWHDGPLASSIATRLPKAEAREIAQAVRRAMKRELIAPPPLLQPRFRPLDEPGRGVIADTLGVPMETDRPAKAQAASGGTVKPN
jgi:anti-sigma factor RsiW